MPLKLYKMDASPPARAVMMTGAALGVTFEEHEVNMQAGEHKTPEYLKKNPMHTIPLLEDGDFLLADSHAIITYLVSKYGTPELKAKLYPSDLNVRATVDSRLFFETSILFPVSKAIVSTMIAAGGVTPQQLGDVNDAFEILEKYLEKTKFLACDHLTVADISCVATISSSAALVPLDKYPKLQAWFKGLEQEDWYKKGNLKGITVMNEYLKSLGITQVVVKK